MTPTYNEAQDGTLRAHHGRVRRTAIAAAKITGVIFGLAALVHVSWNMFAPEMLGLEAIRLKQALGLVVFTSVIAFVLGGVFRIGAGRKHDVGAANVAAPVPQARDAASREARSMSLKRYLISQFKRPRGPLGRLAGWTMARRASNRRRNEWTIELLDLEPEMRVLEIGYGPGYALNLVAQYVKRGRIVGLDHSRTMRDAARARNRAAVEAGRMALFVGSADRLEDCPEPALAGPFDRIFAVNVAMFWDDPAAVFGVLAGRLAPGGRVCITYQPRTGAKTDAAALAHADRLAEAMGAGGLASVRIERLTELSPMAVCVIGHGRGTTA